MSALQVWLEVSSAPCKFMNAGLRAVAFSDVQAAQTGEIGIAAEVLGRGKRVRLAQTRRGRPLLDYALSSSRAGDGDVTVPSRTEQFIGVVGGPRNSSVVGEILDGVRADALPVMAAVKPSYDSGGVPSPGAARAVAARPQMRQRATTRQSVA